MNKIFVFMLLASIVVPAVFAQEIVHEENYFIDSGGGKFFLNDNQYAVVFDSEGNQHIFNQPRSDIFGVNPLVLGFDENYKSSAKSSAHSFLHIKYCMGSSASNPQTACNVIDNSNGQEWDSSWVQQDPRPNMYRFFGLLNLWDSQTFSGCEGENEHKNGQICMAQIDYSIEDKRYIDGNGKLDDFEYRKLNFGYQSSKGISCSCDQPVQSTPGILHWVGGTVSTANNNAMDEYLIYDNINGNQFQAQQIYSVEEVVDEEVSSLGVFIPKLNKFFRDPQETTGSCVVGNLENTLDYFFPDTDSFKSEWDLILEGEFCGGDDGSHEYCAAGTTEQEWTHGYNDYLDYCILTNYRNDGIYFPSDEDIKVQIDGGVPVSLGFRLANGVGHSGTIVGYDESSGETYWYIVDTLQGFQKYSDSWLNYHTQLTGFSIIGFYDCDFPGDIGGSPLFLKRLPAKNKELLFFKNEVIGFVVISLILVIFIILNNRFKKNKRRV